MVLCAVTRPTKSDVELNLGSVGARQKSWAGLCRKSEALPVFKKTTRTQGELDPLFVVPADVIVSSLHELCNGRISPVSRVEPFRLQPTKETFTGCMIR